jgi:hypothetical protein
MLGDTLRTRLLVAGILAAALVLMQGQLRAALDAFHVVETEAGLALVPSAVIVVIVLLLYIQDRRQALRLQRLTAPPRPVSASSIRRCSTR